MTDYRKRLGEATTHDDYRQLARDAVEWIERVEKAAKVLCAWSPWRDSENEDGPDGWEFCVVCGANTSRWSSHIDECPFAALEAALDEKENDDGKEE